MGTMFMADSSFSISSALTMATSLINWVLDTISGNEILVAVLVVGLLIPAGISAFSYLKGAVR